MAAETMMTGIEKIIVAQDDSIREALKIIDDGAVKLAVVVDLDGKLIGTLSDGDIRRGLLRGMDLSDTIEDIFFRNPVTCQVEDSREYVLNLAVHKKIYQIVIVDANDRPVGLHQLDDLVQAKSQEHMAVIMAGGLGQRLRPLTENIPKPMLQVGDRPILETIVKQFASHGVTKLVMCVNYLSHKIEEHFGDGEKFGVSIEYVHETRRHGTAGALSLLKELPEKPFFVMNGDLLTSVNFEQLRDFHMSANALATMCVRQYDMKVPFGVVDVEGTAIKNIVEKPVHKFFVNAGVYMLDPECIGRVPKDSFYDMPTLLNEVAEGNGRVHSFPIREYWLDIGRIDDFNKANQDYGGVFS